MSKSNAYLKLSVVSQSKSPMSRMSVDLGDKQGDLYKYKSDDPTYYLVINERQQRSFSKAISTSKKKYAPKRHRRFYRFIQYTPSNDPDIVDICGDRDQIREIADRFEDCKVSVPLDVFFCVYMGDVGPKLHITNLGVASSLELDEFLVISVNYTNIMAMKDSEIKDTISHQLEHISQIRDGHLVVDGNTVYWKGTEYSSEVAALVARIRDGDEDARDEYNNLPWESVIK